MLVACLPVKPNPKPCELFIPKPMRVRTPPRAGPLCGGLVCGGPLCGLSVSILHRPMRVRTPQRGGQSDHPGSIIRVSHPGHSSFLCTGLPNLGPGVPSESPIRVNFCFTDGQTARPCRESGHCRESHPSPLCRCLRNLCSTDGCNRLAVDRTSVPPSPPLPPSSPSLPSPSSPPFICATRHESHLGAPTPPPSRPPILIPVLTSTQPPARETDAPPRIGDREGGRCLRRAVHRVTTLLRIENNVPRGRPGTGDQARGRPGTFGHTTGAPTPEGYVCGGAMLLAALLSRVSRRPPHPS